MNIRQTLSLAIALCACLAAQAAEPVNKQVSIVLVHGALTDGSSWGDVYSILAKSGYEVQVVQQPLTSFEQDVAATRRVIDQQKKPVILVGHSYGGSIITVAGSASQVKALVYVAGLQPDRGETSAEVAPPKPGAGAHIKSTSDGFLYLDPASFADDFGHDIPADRLDRMAHAQKPIAAGNFQARMPVAAWRDKPSFAIVATEDRVLDVDRARWMADRAGSRISYVVASHAIHISQPQAVARVIEEAAQAVVKGCLQ